MIGGFFMEIESISISETSTMIQNLLDRVSDEEHIFLSHQFVDMRKSIDGLATILQGVYELNPFNGDTFLFCNKKKDKLKILQWDTEGFIVTYKRMERGKFHWPSLSEQEKVTAVKRKDLKRLLQGLPMEKFIPKRNYSIV
jgi:transposase